MLGIDNELEQLYSQAQQDGEAVIKDRWTPGNYGCCSTRAPLIEKYKIKHTDTHASLYLWGKLVVQIEQNQPVIINKDFEATNYDKKIIDWFIQKTKKS
ncbi:hypothetical protein [Enterococcus xiangfangensis]|uniref:hypothetical protein n=1 Tax=Enterococcus xiangfangensis TaxID=1296537 RepID=UPI0010F5A55D|nr:hypothetical protein [Enterococcus xiangfangensis]MBM7712465.1 hypothetical protein [Enterococcus xiangfangensis]NBK09496.1 hypothetical protein [Enterococcus asini]